MARSFFLFLAVLTWLVSPAWAEKKVALVIGNSNYKHATPLPNPTNDARAMSRMLEKIGFEVVSGTDLDRQAKFGVIGAQLSDRTAAHIVLPDRWMRLRAPLRLKLVRVAVDRTSAKVELLLASFGGPTKKMPVHHHIGAGSGAVPISAGHGDRDHAASGARHPGK